MRSLLARPLSKGVALILTGTLLISFGDALAKWLSATYPTAQIVFLRSSSGLLLVFLFVLASGRLGDLKTRRPGWHALRGLLTVCIMLGLFYALANIPMVEVEAIIHAAPLFVALCAPLFLGERVTSAGWAAVVVGFLGILVILRPDPDRFHVAHVYALGCAAAYGAIILLGRRLSATESVLALNFYIYPLAVVVAAFLVRGSWISPTPADWLLFALFGCCATVAIFCFVAALRYLDATLAATLEYVTLIWVTLIGFWIWRERPDLLTAAGILLVVGSGIHIVRHSTRRIDAEILRTPEH
jgi:drug/metabolite transporter (DMT)-like permease